MELLSFGTPVVCRCLQALGSGELWDHSVTRQAVGPKHIAVALTGYISVCSVTSYHACNRGSCLHCNNISSAGASWPGRLRQLLQALSPRSPGACQRPTHSPSTCWAPAAPAPHCPQRLPAPLVLGDGSPLPALAFLPLVPKGLPAPEVAITPGPPTIAWDGPINRSL